MSRRIFIILARIFLVLTSLTVVFAIILMTLMEFPVKEAVSPVVPTMQDIARQLEEIRAMREVQDDLRRELESLHELMDQYEKGSLRSA